MDVAALDVDCVVLTPTGLADLMRLLIDDGHELIGPTVRGEAIVIEPISGIEDLPRGWTDEQAPGHYRLRPRGDDAYFGFASAFGGWKRYLFPAHTVLWRAHRDGQSVAIEPSVDEVPRRAFFGIRGCDLAAITIQDTVFLARGNPDPIYAGRREHLFVVAVDCAEPAATCFCPSMGTGPAVQPGQPGQPGHSGADLVLTELEAADPARHRFLLRPGTDSGAAVLDRLTLAGAATAATETDLVAALASQARSMARICRQVQTDNLPGLLQSSAGESVWEEIATQCLSCGNCTMACPTCFCSDIDDLPDVTTDTQERVRVWASCFERDHSYLHGGAIRQSINSRYRQWLTHKFSTWWDQFGTSGCVGCGRCMTWCPAAIDITANLATVRCAGESGPATGSAAPRAS